MRVFRLHNGLGRYSLLLCGVCAVASAALLARLGLDAGLGALPLAAWRLAIASLVLGVWQFAARSSAPVVRPDVKARLFAAGVCLALHFVTWFASLGSLSVARSTLLVATSPLWAGLLGLCVPALRPRPIFWAGLGVAVCGMALVTGQWGMVEGVRGAQNAGWGRGDLLAIAGAILIVPYLLLVQRAQEEYGTLRVVTWTYAYAACCLWPVVLAEGHGALPPTKNAWLSVLGMALVPQLVGHTALNRSLKYFTAAQVTVVSLLEPAFAALLAWLFLAERITLAQGMGGLLLLAGVAVTLRPPRKSQPPDFGHPPADIPLPILEEGEK